MNGRMSHEDLLDRLVEQVEFGGDVARPPETAADDLTVQVVDRTISIECLSGGREEHDWRGIPIEELLNTVNPPPGTTHLVFASDDGHQSCVPVQRAIEGIFALERDGDALDAPRFVAPNVAGPRTIKNVRTIECVELAPGEDRTVFESFEV